MLKKFFNGDDKPLTSIFLKKTLVKDIYSKFYVRKTLIKDSKHIQILDKDISLANLKEKTTFKNISEGFSKSLDVLKYQHKLDKDLKFPYLILSKQVCNVNKIKKFYSLLYRLNKKTHINGSFLLHKPVRGGFEGSSFGVRGFLPKRQGKLFIKKNNTSLIKLKSSKVVIKKLNLLKKSSIFSSNLLVPRLKGQLHLGKGLAFLKKSDNFFQNRNFFDFIFTNPNFKKYFYANKKRIKNKNFKSKDKKAGSIPVKPSSRVKKSSRKKSF